MILVLNTTTDREITENLRNDMNAKGITAEVVEAGHLKRGNCIGCNHCWLKTPGECTVKDDFPEIFRKIVHADQLWVISDTALGFLDHKGKNIYDRLIPLATMYLHFKDGQLRHVMRYDRQTNIGIIYKGAADREYLKRWNERATLNFDCHSLGVFNTEELKEAVSCLY